MALCTAQMRDEKPVKVQWTWWHLGIMLDKEKFPGLKESGRFEVKEDITFATTEEAVFTDGVPGVPFLWEIKKGDILELWYDR
jgi:hypothetical protein